MAERLACQKLVLLPFLTSSSPKTDPHGCNKRPVARKETRATDCRLPHSGTAGNASRELAQRVKPILQSLYIVTFEQELKGLFEPSVRTDHETKKEHHAG